MRYINKYLDGEHKFLEVTVYDREDVQSLPQYWNEKNVITSVNNLQYLADFKQIERLILTSGETPNNVLEIIKTQQCLRALKIDYEETALSTSLCIDVSGFPSLEYLFSRSSFNFTGVSDSKTLRTLIVQSWYSDDLSKLSHSQIDSLSICCGRLKTLKGIENVPLQILSLANLRGLSDISYVEKLPLKILELVNCNKVTSFENLSSDTLEYLMIYGRNKVRSGSFIKKYKRLKRVMLDIIIEDGDLSVFDNLEKATILTDRRHYNRKNSQLPKNENQYVIDSIPMWRYIYSGRLI
ncbi:MAG: hypothetical protein ACI3XR_06885 [Eubacteriales bacterium]